MSLRERTIRGASWATAGRVVQQAVQFGATLLLARLLTPDDFGLVAMVLVFSGFANLFADFGFSLAIVQAQEIEERHRASVLVVNIGLGLAIFGLFVAAAPAIAAFYEEPELTALTRWIALTFPLGAIGSIHRALLRRELDFKRLAIMDVVAGITSGGLAVGLALGGHGVMALVWMLVSRGALTSVLAWALCRWRPAHRFDVEAVREMLAFSTRAGGAQVVNYWVVSADNLLIGEFLGSGALGLYSRAYSVMLLPLSQVTAAVRQVLLPALSRMQDDRERLVRAYVRVIGTIAVLTFPMSAGLAAVADDFVVGLFGPHWAGMIPVLRILCLVGALQSVAGTVGPLLQSVSRADIQFRWALVKGGTIITAFFFAAPWGIETVATVYAVHVSLVFAPNFLVAGRFTGLKFTDVLREIRGPALCAVAMSAVVFSAQSALPTDEPLIHLALSVALGVVVYAALVLAVRPPGVEGLRQILDQLRARNARA